MTSQIRTILLGVVASLWLTLAVQAATFIKVADTATAIPAGTGNFTGFMTYPGIATDGNTVVFSGAGVSSQQGIYSYTLATNTLTRIADKTSIMPGAANPVQVLDGPSVFGGRVGFGGYTANDQKGIYTATTSGTGLLTIADLNTPVPGGPGGNFATFAISTLHSGNVAFYAIGPGPSWSGIYLAPDTGGPITAIADHSTPIPGSTGNFTGFGGVSLHGSALVFRGLKDSNTFEGIYSCSTSSGALARVADPTTPVPNSAGTFNHFWTAVTDGTYAAFNAQGTANSNGIYRYRLDGTQPTRIADLTTPIPGHPTMNFGGFDGSVCIGSGVTLFNANSPDWSVLGVYAHANGILNKLIETGDALDGKIVGFAKMYGQGSAGGLDLVAFYATFTDGSAGIYAAQVPEPAAALLLPCALMLLRRPRPRPARMLLSL